jgi:hypothetical protein
MKVTEEEADLLLIGQFYVVFSAFLFVCRVIDASKHNDDY